MTMKTIFRLALLFCVSIAAIAQPIQRTPFTTNTAGQRIPAGVFGTFTANTNVTAPAIVGTNTVRGGVVTAVTNAVIPETGGASLTLFGAVADGEYLKRFGTSIIGDTPGGVGDMLQATYDADTDDIVDTAEGLVDGAAITNLTATTINGTTVNAGTGVVTNGMTVGGLSVTTNATVGGTLGVTGASTLSGAVTMPDLTVTNGATIGGLTVRSNISAAGTGYFNDLVVSNSVSLPGTNGSAVFTDGAADNDLTIQAGDDMDADLVLNASNIADDELVGRDGTAIEGFPMIDVDSETQAGGTTMAVTFPTGPQYLRDVILSLTNSMVFTNTANAAAGRSVTYYIFPNANSYTLNVDTDFKIVGGTFTQGMVVTNRFVLTFKPLSTTKTNVWCSGNYVQ